MLTAFSTDERAKMRERELENVGGKVGVEILRPDHVRVLSVGSGA